MTQPEEPPAQNRGNNSRKQIPKRMRFEVLKRDSFACRYCGRKAPEALLVIDHIEPVSKGGTNDLFNLVTACKDCNAGKSDRRLSDSTILDKQREQLEELQYRKEQIDMMFKWKKGLLSLDDDILKQLSDFWSEQVRVFRLNEDGMRILKRLKRKFDIEEIMEAMRIAVEQYVEFVDDIPTKDSVEHALSKVGGICVNKREEKTSPHMQRLRYIRGILRNRLTYVNEQLVLGLLKDAHIAGADIQSLEEHAKTVKSWSEWRTAIESFVNEQNTQAPDDSDPNRNETETRADFET